MTFRIQLFWRNKSFQGVPNQDGKSRRFQGGIEILRGGGQRITTISSGFSEVDKEKQLLWYYTDRETMQLCKRKMLALLFDQFFSLEDVSKRTRGGDEVHNFLKYMQLYIFGCCRVDTLVSVGWSVLRRPRGGWEWGLSSNKEIGCRGRLWL